jgi:phage-related baseplate assembly protein
MSRFVAPDLSKLPPPDVLEPLSFETVLQARLADLKTRAEFVNVSYDTGHLKTDPLRLDQEASTDRELTIRARINDAARAVMLATSWGSNLDHIAATYYGIARLTTPAEDGTEIPEADDDFRARIALAPEAFSTAGPEGAYVFHALELDGRRAVSDAAAYSEEDGAKYADGTAVIAPEVLVVVVPSPERVETEPWAAEMTLKGEVLAALSANDVRPIGDKVTVQIANRMPYTVTATLKVKAGLDYDILEGQAEERVRTYAASQRRVGAVIERLGLGAVLSVGGVMSIELSSPADDVDPGSLGAPDLETVTITVETAAETWR